MSKPANKTLVGTFVIGAILLAVVAIIVFGSGRYFTNRFVNVMYFHSSVKGLNVGSPLMFRGVKIGAVKSIDLRYDAKDLSFLICVYVEIDPGRMVYIDHQPGTQHTEDLIKKGLRAQLEPQSMVTGHLAINLDFFPGKPAKLMGLDKRYPEIPTISSGMDDLLTEAEQLPLKELVTKAIHTLDGLDRLVNSPQMASNIQTLNDSLESTKAILGKIDRQTDPLLASMKEGVDEFRTIARKGEGLPDKIGQALEATLSTLHQAESTLLSAQEVASGDSALAQQVDGTLREVSDTARSFRFLGDYLQRHPEALLRGKRIEKGE